VLFLLNLVQGAVQAELDRFFEQLDGVGEICRSVTKAAFTQARRKLHFAAFIEINRELVEWFEAHGTPRRWQGFRLLAVDGSTVPLPGSAEVLAWFGANDAKQSPPCAMGRVSMLYDVVNRVVVQAHLAAYRTSERDLALAHLDSLRPGDLLLGDRGYPGFWLFSALQQRSVAYCVRVSQAFSGAVRAFVVTGAVETVVEMQPNADAQAFCRKHGIPVRPLSLRLVRVELSSGEVEVLATSLLDATRYPAEIFAELYHRRWGIEEGYKLLKCRIELENFSGKSVNAVLQDFHAKVVTSNLVTLLAQSAQAEIASEPSPPTRQVNMSHAVACVKGSLVRLFTAGDPRRFIDAILHVLRRTLEAVRPGRSFPRIKKRSTLRKFRPGYKRCG